MSFGLTKDPSNQVNNTVYALELLSEFGDKSYINTILSWTSQIVWLDFDEVSGNTKLTSSTFPSLPHTTFVTDKAFIHIPPLAVIDSISAYFLAENIFHEALHQKLSASLLFDDLVDPEFDSRVSFRISVPWRGQSWEPDRIVHAAFVYMHLLKLRQDALDADLPYRDHIKSAWDTGREALRYLVSRFPDCDKVFTVRGKRLLQDIAEIAASRIIV